MQSNNHDIARLLEVIGNVAAGDYSNDIIALTGDSTPEPLRTIAEAMGMMMVKVEAREYQLEMLIDELRQLNDQIKRNSIQMVSAMARALEARDAYTRGHAERVGSIASEIAIEMGLDEQAVELVRTAGVLHDIGKIGCSDRIFQAHEAKNPPDVVKEIMSHPAVGAEILRQLDFLSDVVEIIRAHHERIDGKGYPNQMVGQTIPLGARIIAVADAFDAMTTDRSYQQAMMPEAALEILRKSAGTKWDADCVSAFERLKSINGRQEQDICQEVVI